MDRLERVQVDQSKLWCWCTLLSRNLMQSEFVYGQHIQLRRVDTSTRAPVLDPVCVRPCRTHSSINVRHGIRPAPRLRQTRAASHAAASDHGLTQRSVSSQLAASRPAIACAPASRTQSLQQACSAQSSHPQSSHSASWFILVMMGLPPGQPRSLYERTHAHPCRGLAATVFCNGCVMVLVFG